MILKKWTKWKRENLPQKKNEKKGEIIFFLNKRKINSKNISMNLLIVCELKQYVGYINGI